MDEMKVYISRMHVHVQKRNESFDIQGAAHR